MCNFPSVRPSVSPSVRPSVNIYPGCLVSATPLTVLYWSFWNFVYVFFLVWRCAYGLDIIVRLFLSLFPHCELSHFFTSIYRQWVPLVSATPLTVLYWLFWNFACVFFMVWGCACGFGIIVRTFLSLFPHCELSHFSPSVYRQWVPLFERNSSYSFVPIVLKLCICFFFS